MSLKKIVQCWLVLFICFLSACKSDKHKEKPLLTDKNDINEIVKAVIYKEHLNPDAPLVSELRRVKILNPNYAINIPRPIGSIYINDLLNIKVNKKKFFRKTDSLNMYFQNDLFKTFQIEKTLSKRIKLISFKAVLENIKSKRTTHLYEMTIPIFSSDHKRAYVELDYSCPLCGKGIALFLEKFEGKWVIVDEEYLWVS